MEQTKLRKGYNDCRNSNTLPSAQKPCNKKKSRHKSNECQQNYLQPYDWNFAPYAVNIPPQARIHHQSHRLIDSSVCHYPLYSLEPVPLPYYPPLIQPGAAPVERVVRLNRTNEPKIPPAFQTVKQNNDLEQDYMSLPPVNCDLNSLKPNDDESTCKRRFSDPGIGQVSSDECSGSRSGASSNSSSLQDLHIPYAYGLIEQVNELKENHSNLTKEMKEVKMEMQSVKLLSASYISPECATPGILSESIAEIREATKLMEESLQTKMENLMGKNASECNELHRDLEEKIMQKLSERLSKLEEQVEKLLEGQSGREVVPPRKRENEQTVNEDLLTIQQQLIDSEQEKLSLRKELQEAIDSRKKAEANTLRLERLVSMLHRKINGVSIDPCTSEEKQSPKSSLLDQNPFIIANNKKVNQKKSLKRPENDNDETDSNTGLGEAPLVTITGPVTDL